MEKFYWGMLVINQDTCPICMGKLKNVVRNYMLYSTDNTKSYTNYYISKHCEKCKLNFVDKKYYKENCLEKMQGLRAKFINGRIKRCDAVNFLFTPQIDSLEYSFPQSIIVKSNKDIFETDSFFKHIFNNGKLSNIKIDIKPLRESVIDFIANMNYYRKNQIKPDFINKWSELIRTGLNFGCTYEVQKDDIKKIINCIYNKKLKLYNKEELERNIKMELVKIVEKSYFQVNEKTKTAYVKLCKAKKENDFEKIEKIKKWCKEGHIKQAVYESSSFQVYLYDDEFACKKNHEVEEFKVYVKRITDFCGIPVNLQYCYKCENFSLSRQYYYEIKNKNPLFIFDIDFELSDDEFVNSYYSKEIIRRRSKYKRVGYSVASKNNMGLKERQKLIVSMIESGYINIPDFISFLEWLLRFQDQSKTNCRAEWAADLNFVRNYNRQEQMHIIQPLIEAQEKTIAKIWDENFYE